MLLRSTTPMGLPGQVSSDCHQGPTTPPQNSSKSGNDGTHGNTNAQAKEQRRPTQTHGNTGTQGYRSSGNRGHQRQRPTRQQETNQAGNQAKNLKPRAVLESKNRTDDPERIEPNKTPTHHPSSRNPHSPKPTRTADLALGSKEGRNWTRGNLLDRSGGGSD